MKSGLTYLLVLGAAAIVAAGVVRYSHENRRDSIATLFDQADRLQETGQQDQAIAKMKQALAVDPKYFEARLALSDMYESANRETDAAAVLEQGLRVAPEDEARYANALSDHYKMVRDYARAISYLREALNAPPSRTLNRHAMERELAGLLDEAGQLDESEQAWQAYAAKYPSDGSAARGLARIQRERKEQALGKATGATAPKTPHGKAAATHGGPGTGAAQSGAPAG